MVYDFKPWLKKRLTSKRYIHSLEVEKRAVYLSELHGVNAEKAAIAGLLHDCCHSLPKDEQLKIIKSRGILLDDFTTAQPQLWHAIAGEITVSDELGVDDNEILEAIRYHTTGNGGMAQLSQVVYLADLTSGDRDYEEVAKDRKLSEKSLEQAMFRHLKHTVKALAKQGEPIVPDAWRAYNYFWQLNQSKQSKV